MKSFYYTFLIFPSLTLLLNGCSVLVGNVKPVEEKAISVETSSLEMQRSGWNKLDIKSASLEENPDDIPDSAWQSSKTAAVISLNSACRKKNDDHELTLKEFTTSLLSQWRELKILSQREIQVSRIPALETTAEGIYLGRQRKFQTIVVKTQACMYELVYLSPLKTFDQELAVFQEFRANLNLK
jgi:hypothetical protein